MSTGEWMKKPTVIALFAVLFGLVVGLVWAYYVQPVRWTDVPPNQLGAYYQEQYLRMAIDSYQVNGDQELAINRYQSVGANAPAILQNVVSNPGNQDPSAILRFVTLVQPETVTGPGEEGGGEGQASPLLKYLIIVIAVLAIGGVFYLGWRVLGPRFKRRAGAGPTPAQQARELSRQAEMTDYAAIGEEPPIVQFVTTYVLGDDLFDDSFSIDAPSGEFMGECGVGISETIGVGEPKKVTAFEVWLFDKNDIQTVTKVLMSAHAFNDPATYQRLENKGEPILVERGKQVVLETAALQLVAVISDTEYGQGALPGDSYFERLTLELAVWQKKAPQQQ